MFGIARSVPWVLIDQTLDKDGCFGIVRGKLNNIRLTIVGVYAPNTSQAPFGEEVFKTLVLNQDSEVLMLGDFNAFFDNDQDRSRVSSTPYISTNFLQYKELFGVVDIWRLVNEVKCDYTFFPIYTIHTQ